MNKRIKKKYKKEKFVYYKGQMIWVNHVYSEYHSSNSYRVMLCYNVEGNERYFKHVDAAKRYIDRNSHEYYLKELRYVEF
jgi:hypothetical protein